MSGSRTIRPRKSYGRRVEYSTILKRREIRREIIIWIVEILVVIAIAAVIAFYLL